MEDDSNNKEEGAVGGGFDDPEEQAHFKQVVGAFFNYSVRSTCGLRS
jgi:hypothetical protein